MSCDVPHHITVHEVEYWRRKLQEACDERDEARRVVTSLRDQVFAELKERTHCREALDGARTERDIYRHQRDEYRRQRDFHRKRAGEQQAATATLRKERNDAREALVTSSNSCAELREERDTFRRQLDELAKAPDNRQILQARLEVALRDLDRERQTLKTDGDLLSDLIVGCCPKWLNDEAARDLAEQVVADLATIDGVVVLRGTHSQPWTSEEEVLTTANTHWASNDAEDEAVDATTWGDEWSEYGVFVRRDEKTICVHGGCTEAQARLLAAYVPRAWVQRRRVLAEDWEAI